MENGDEEKNDVSAHLQYWAPKKACFKAFGKDKNGIYRILFIGFPRDT